MPIYFYSYQKPVFNIKFGNVQTLIIDKPTPNRLKVIRQIVCFLLKAVNIIIIFIIIIPKHICLSLIFDYQTINDNIIKFTSFINLVSHLIL